MRTAIIPLQKPRNKKANTADNLNEREAAQQARIIEFFPNRMPLDEVKAIWNDDQECYSNEDLLRLRDWFYMVADLVIKSGAASDQSRLERTDERQAAVTATAPLPINPTASANEVSEKSHPLHPRIHRRAS